MQHAMMVSLVFFVWGNKATDERETWRERSERWPSIVFFAVVASDRLPFFVFPLFSQPLLTLPLSLSLSNPNPRNTPQQPQIILLREGTDTSQGRPQLVSNINACAALADVVRTTLGPRGMDKLIHDDRGNVTISNDGATIMRLLEVVHPAASLLVDVARSQDAEAGDGTTTVVLLAGELLRAVKPFVEDGAPPRAVARALRAAGALACARLRA